MPERSASPLQLAIARFWHRTGVKPSVVALGFLILVAIYAPFIASDVAIVWWRDGLSFPLVADLFNRRSYLHAHDLLFNVLTLLLPLLLLFYVLTRARWPFGRFFRWALGSTLVIWLACMVPCYKGAGNEMRAIWDYRSPTPYTIDNARAVVGETPGLFPLIPHRYDATYPGAGLKGPGTLNPASGAKFWLGTDVSGKDVAAELVFGARISLTIGLVATGIAMLIGTILGAVSGYFGGKTDLVLQRLVEIMLCFPTFILVLTVVAMTSRNIFIIMAVLGLTGWAGTARLVRGEFLAQAVRDYVVAAEALGLPRWRIMFRHILPNTMAPLIISATFGIAGSVLGESGLSFLGLGDPTTPSWGMLLNQGRDNIHYAWLIYAPGLAVFLLVTSLNLIGNGLREAFDPKTSE
jgi:peptide/nickel transport system permease protein